MFDKLAEFPLIWYGCLGSVDRAKHQIELNFFDVQPVNCAHNHAARKAHKLEKTKVNKMLPMNIIKLIQSEWVSGILFVRRRTSPYASVSPRRRRIRKL